MQDARSYSSAMAVLRDKAQVVYDMVKEDLGDDVVQGFLDAVDAARN